MKLLGFCFGTTASIRTVQGTTGSSAILTFHASRWDKPLGTAGLSLSPTAPGLCIHFLLHLLASTHQLLAVVIGTSWWEWGHDILCNQSCAYNHIYSFWCASSYNCICYLGGAVCHDMNLDILPLNLELWLMIYKSV